MFFRSIIFVVCVAALSAQTFAQNPQYSFVLRGSVAHRAADESVRFREASLAVRADGSFEGVVPLPAPAFAWFGQYKSDFFPLYAENGDTVEVSFDAAKFEPTLRYGGKYPAQSRYYTVLT